jgi:glyoxylase-like metal-dependent hydrolase (beta-lactamase superfamily II)
MKPLNPILLEAHNPGPLTGRGNNTYLLVDDGSGEGTLIDAGIGQPRHLDAIDFELTERHARLVQVIATHGHADHTAGAAALAQRHPGPSFRKYPEPAPTCEAGVPWRPLGDGDVISVGHDHVTVVHTPGHAPDHVALWHASTRVAFIGDLVVLGRSVMIRWDRGGNMIDYLTSLERLRNLDPLILYPAHGAVIDAPVDELTRYLVHRHQREQQVVDALSAGSTTVPDIADSIYDGLEPALFPAACETVRAHLEKLKAEQRAADAGDRWVLV